MKSKRIVQNSWLFAAFAIVMVACGLFADGGPLDPVNISECASQRTTVDTIIDNVSMVLTRNSDGDALAPFLSPAANGQLAELAKQLGKDGAKAVYCAVKLYVQGTRSSRASADPTLVAAVQRGDAYLAAVEQAGRRE